MPVLAETLKGLVAFVGYYIVMASLLVLVKVRSGRSGEWFRKLLHLVCVMSVFVLLYAIETWYIAALVALSFILVVYPAIRLLERYPKAMQFLHQRRSGEIRRSLVIAFLMMAALITFFWGLLGEAWKFMIVVAVMAWGFGDAAAALVGTAFGRHRIRHRLVEGTKSLEGTLAMLVVSAVAIIATLLLYTSLPWYVCLGVALLVAPISALVELLSRRGSDTITVPLATAFAIFVLLRLLTVVEVLG